MVSESSNEVEEGAQNGEHEYRSLSHVALRASLPIRPTPRSVRSSGHIGRVLARRARGTRCPVSWYVRRAELLRLPKINEILARSRHCLSWRYIFLFNFFFANVRHARQTLCEVEIKARK